MVSRKLEKKRETQYEQKQRIRSRHLRRMDMYKTIKAERIQRGQIGLDKDVVLLDNIYKAAKSLGMAFNARRMDADDRLLMYDIDSNKRLVSKNLSRIHYYYSQKKSLKNKQQIFKNNTYATIDSLSREEQMAYHKLATKLNSVYEAAKSLGLKMEYVNKQNFKEMHDLPMARLGDSVALTLRRMHVYNLRKKKGKGTRGNRKKNRGTRAKAR